MPVADSPKAPGTPSIRTPVEGGSVRKGGVTMRKARRRVEARLATLDTDGDGVIDREELVDFLEDTIARETRYAYLKWAGGLLLIFTLLMLGAIAGLSYGIVAALQDTKSSCGALADKAFSDTLRATSAGCMGLNVTLTKPDLAGCYASPSGRRLLASNASIPETMTIPLADALTACTWPTEGHETFPLTATTNSGIPGPGVTCTTIKSEKGCITWAKNNKQCKKKKGDKAKACQPGQTNPDATGTVTFNGQTYKVICPAGSQTCTVTLVPAVKNSKGRRLNLVGDPNCIDYSDCGDFQKTHECKCPSGSPRCNYNFCITKKRVLWLFPGGERKKLPNGSTSPPIGNVISCQTFTATCEACFPADAAVAERDPASGAAAKKAVIDTTPGDVLQVVKEDKTLGWSPVYAFPHYERTGTYDYVVVTSDSGAELRLSADHYLYTARHPSTPFAARSPTAGRNVRPGHYIWRAAAGNSRVAVQRVAAVRRAKDTGLVAPFTVRGNVVVDGVAASSFVDMPGSEAAMHAATSLGRTLWRTSPRFVQWLHARRITEPLMLGIGAFLRKYQDASTAANAVIHRMVLSLTSA